MNDTDILERLRKEAADCLAWDGARMTEWDKIRAAVERLKGSDLPRLMYEGELEDFHDLLSLAANEIERLRAETMRLRARSWAMVAETERQSNILKSEQNR